MFPLEGFIFESHSLKYSQSVMLSWKMTFKWSRCSWNFTKGKYNWKQSKKYMAWHCRDFILETQIFEVLKTNRVSTRKINGPGEDWLRGRGSRTLPHSWTVRDSRRRGIYAILKKTLTCCQGSCLLGLGMWLSDRVLSSEYQGPVFHSQHFPNKIPDFLTWLTRTHN